MRRAGGKLTPVKCFFGQNNNSHEKGKQAKAGKPFVPNCIIAINKKEKRKTNLFYKLVSFLFPFLSVFSLLVLFLCVLLLCFVLLCFWYCPQAA